MTKRIIFIVPTDPETRHLAIMPTHLFRIISSLPSTVQTEVLDMSMRYGIPLSPQGQEKVLTRLTSDLDQLVDARSTIVGFSCTCTREILASLPLAQMIKTRYGATTVLGGYAPSSCPQVILEDYGDLFDYIVVGRGEETCAQLLAHFANGVLDAESIPNLARRVNGKVVLNRRKPPVPLDKLPLIDMSSLSHIDQYPYIVYNASIGCPYRCAFCLESTVNPTYEQRQATQVVADLRHVCALSGQRAVALYDANFGARRDVHNLLQLLAEEGFDYGLEMRIDRLNEGVLRLLQHRCKILFVGLESVSIRSLTEMQKTKSISMYIQRAKEVLPRCFDLGIPVMLGLLPNYPLNRDEDARACLEFCQTLQDLYLQTGARSGLVFSPTHVKVYYGSMLHRELPDLVSQGVRVRAGLPSIYAGQAVRTELVQVVADASPSLPEEKYLEYEQSIRALSVFPENPSALAALARLLPKTTSLREGKLPIQYYSDQDKDVIRVESITTRLDDYLVDAGLTHPTLS